MKNKSILITGASGSIGFAISKKIIENGYDAVMCYNKNDSFIEKIKDFAKDYDVNIRFLKMNITDREEVKNILIKDIEENGAYYGIVLSSGITMDNVFPAMTGDEWDNVIDVNLKSFYNIVNPLIMPMIRNKKGGRIIAISSITGIIGNRGQVNYAASKAGLIGAVKSLAIELGKRNITVNCIAPGIIESEMINEEIIEHAKNMIALKRIGKPEDVANAVNFLLSDEANYITKQVISVDGGMN
ncbi:3-oxoacyl-ACP reductase FabG [Brachyspira hyodysenteriae]|uniref:3-oxoacyl-ACP reductase FabG n=1 Tax=Brachyspira hyodysenteriae TaxID=159 RepID=UPI0022CDA39E|nr:3-oxoacyl-ACP reductase FabG [Brachyspira hyodysenteriae]MCZ9890796.1 3-oxoacyl-ACP reductase FabG [Brachyspira hyodysenteriae]MDA0000137.1 3-oxoacyl-ACP reductase FabG [Brachyspira hyodysenteriae]MDA0005141.1 3-oxoacyl-ACP reductase FabG [Brachyspira hyodysenteriae]MDA0027963.1 3-oxoacyl-ACP reductase FabG [Brachyspira hyodysenteriae]MDA0040109.1 3-oxoacyl-ACP reductase FabG [Brachyspira hyodysenteriae]